MITYSRYRQLINMTYLFWILTKWLFHLPSPLIYCYQKIAAPSYVGGLFFLSGYSGNTSEGLYLGECFCWTSYELKNHFNIIDWYFRCISGLWVYVMVGLSYLDVFGCEVFLTSRSLVGRAIYFGRRLLSIYLHTCLWNESLWCFTRSLTLFCSLRITTVVTSSHCSPYGTFLHSRILQAAAGNDKSHTTW